MAVKTKQQRRRKIRYSIRKKIRGTPVCPRLAVYRSNKAISCQLIDDVHGVTLASAHSSEGDISAQANKVAQAKAVGELIATKAGNLNVSEVKFDRGGYLYHGRVKALAEGARDKGLKL